MKKIIYKIAGLLTPCLCQASFAAVDFRTASPLGSMSDRVAYVASISDCTDLVYVDISAGLGK